MDNKPSMDIRLKIISITIVIVVITISIIGSGVILGVINFGEKYKFIGSWTMGNSTIPKFIFYSNDTMYHIAYFQNNTWNYEIKDDKLILNLIDGSYEKVYKYSFSKDNTILTLDSMTSNFSSVWYKVN
ncbi:hypothetical protein AYK20_07920 [Thermoplasmatales archaeon SG8-52-1]|nr:MAG: hypothetical protein AYK20_07920 [Thermoplasmatales archaeon SG8-52-1]